MHAAYGHINKTQRIVSLLHVYEQVSTLKYVIVFSGLCSAHRLCSAHTSTRFRPRGCSDEV